MAPALRNLSKQKIILIGLFFALLNVVFLVTEQFWGLLIPFGIAVVALVFLALDKVLLFLIFATPLSIFYFNDDLNLGFTLPTEPLLFGILLLFLFKVLFRGGFDRKIAFHPLSLAILFNVFWILITSITSEMPLVSFKFFVARLWFLAAFFYLMSQLLKKKEENFYRMIWLYILPLAAVVIYTMVVHSQWGFTKESSVWVMFPFFKEHTSYGAVLALYIPITFAFAFLLPVSLNRKLLAVLIFLILTVGVIFSFTRAAWVSIAAGLMIALLIYLRIGRLGFWSLVALMIGTAFYFQDTILERFEKNDATSSDDLTEHVESISNISTDPSNMERINRWKSAFRMYAERPVFGFGPGTYMFLYAPYQKPHEKTIISTNAGDMGNAHSEYIGPLAESGTLGMLSVLLIVYFTVVTGIRVYYRLERKDLKIYALALLIGLCTYWIHGFLNNFLDMDKAAVPVWSFTAALIVLEKYYLKAPSLYSENEGSTR